jgi:hypothetical protein
MEWLTLAQNLLTKHIGVRVHENNPEKLWNILKEYAIENYVDVFSPDYLNLNNEFPSTKASCPQWIIDKLDFRGIAIWIMDNGSINKKISKYHNINVFI